MISDETPFSFERSHLVLDCTLLEQVEATRKPAVGRDENEQDVLLGRTTTKQGLGVIKPGTRNVREHVGDGVLVRGSLLRPLERRSEYAPWRSSPWYA
jgi:hypothetical protein